jgi:hypothetical protein
MATVINLCDVAAGRDRSAASASTVGDRFRIWLGRSGRRHVFTRVEPGFDPADLDGAVVLLARCDRDGSPVVERVMLAGDLPAVMIRREIWAHFLAETDAERLAVMVDLTPVPTAPRRDDLETPCAA